MREITVNEFKNEVLNGKGVTLVDFHATWCGPCKMLAPILSQLEAEMPDVNFVKVDIDTEIPLTMEYGISSVPTMMIFKNGQRVDQMVGLAPKQMIADKLRYFNQK